jgi:hypothetical protein
MDKDIRSKKGFNPPVEPGSKIVLYYMKDDSGVSPGTKGVVKRVIDDPFEPGSQIITVDWESGSSLSLLPSIDVYKLAKD